MHSHEDHFQSSAGNSHHIQSIQEDHETEISHSTSKNENTEESEVEENNEVAIELLAIIKQLQLENEDMQKTTTKFQKKSTEEIEILKSSKLRHIPIQTIINEYLTPIQRIIERIESKTRQLYEDTKNYQRINPKLMSDQIAKKIHKNLTRYLTEEKKTEDKNHHLLTTKTQQPKRHEEGKTKENKTKNQLTKLIIIPKDIKQASEINKQIRE